MFRVAPAVLLMILAPVALAEEPASEAAAGNPLHFRLELGVDTIREIDARLVETAGEGTGYDAALLDLDGDGEFEFRRALGETVHARTGRKTRETRVSVRHEEAIWTLELDALKSPTSARDLTAGTTSVHWSVQAGGLYVRFLGSPLELHDSAEAATAAAAFRMGSPLAMVVGVSTRGSSPTVTADLRGPNGGSLAMVMRDRKEVRPEVRILAGEEAKVTARPGYS